MDVDWDPHLRKRVSWTYIMSPLLPPDPEGLGRAGAKGKGKLQTDSCTCHPEGSSLVCHFRLVKGMK